MVLRSASTGEAARNVRSVIDPLLLDLCKPGRAMPPLVPFALPLDEVDPRLTMRFVCTLPTGSGDVVWERRAAAAAAEERDGDDLDV